MTAWRQSISVGPKQVSRKLSFQELVKQSNVLKANRHISIHRDARENIMIKSEHIN